MEGREQSKNQRNREDEAETSNIERTRKKKRNILKGKKIKKRKRE
jgi:hypothetical protein